MTSITIIGTGNMGTALSDLAGRANAQVQPVGHDDEPGALTGDIVLLAVPYPALADVASRYGDQLAGKVVVDLTNPVDFETFTPVDIEAGSAAAELAAALPDARVVKAFNTNFAATLSAGSVGDAPVTVLVAGDDPDAKREVIDLVDAAGAQGVDAGPLASARQLEAVGYLQMGLAITEAIPWTGGFTIAR
ncbi:NADPH-dependent F420 reductase [Antribacter gilvus]|uniref:NADPH-dependent F420 reductase n=1 Tax=Antribacter gilvus TaxID=2304675 RepID=UPI000F77EACA|nr:NAD(P)-binding domain-containing protein [Antribacter gilvus]